MLFIAAVLAGTLFQPEASVGRQPLAEVKPLAGDAFRPITRAGFPARLISMLVFGLRAVLRCHRATARRRTRGGGIVLPMTLGALLRLAHLFHLALVSGCTFALMGPGAGRPHYGGTHTTCSTRVGMSGKCGETEGERRKNTYCDLLSTFHDRLHTKLKERLLRSALRVAGFAASDALLSVSRLHQHVVNGRCQTMPVLYRTVSATAAVTVRYKVFARSPAAAV